MKDDETGTRSSEREGRQAKRERLLAQSIRDREAGTREDAERRADELDAVFDAMLDAVIVYDADGVVTRANRVAATTTAVDPVGVHRAQLIQAFATRTMDGRPAAVDDLPRPVPCVARPSQASGL